MFLSESCSASFAFQLEVMTGLPFLLCFLQREAVHVFGSRNTGIEVVFLGGGFQLAAHKSYSWSFSLHFSPQILEQIIFSLWIKVAIHGWCDPFLSLGNPVDRISTFSPGKIYFPSHDGQAASIPSNSISHPHVQLTLLQMAPFCLSGWGDLTLPGHNSGWLQPQRTSPLEQIRLRTITTLLGPLTPTSFGSTAVTQECGRFSTPFTPVLQQQATYKGIF